MRRAGIAKNGDQNEGRPAGYKDAGTAYINTSSNFIGWAVLQA
jgi:hypothetical protein